MSNRTNGFLTLSIILFVGMNRTPDGKDLGLDDCDGDFL